jgi:transposase
MESGAVVAVTLQGANLGDTTTVMETIIAATENLREVSDDPRTQDKIDENFMSQAVADKGYHSNGTMTDLEEMDIRSYVAEPDRGRRDWTDQPEAQAAVYANRRRTRGKRGKELMRQRGELIERSFAHNYETGAMRRTHLKHHDNIAKRLMIHVGGFNLSLVMRKLIGIGKPRRLQGLFASIFRVIYDLRSVLAAIIAPQALVDTENRIRPTVCAAA